VIAEFLPDECKQVGEQLALFIPINQCVKVTQAIRKIVLDWSLQLEEDGIVGEGLSFSPKEKQLAATQNYHIGTFIGTMSNSQLQQHTQDSTQTSTLLADNGGL
jgi:hypothetical protein